MSDTLARMSELSVMAQDITKTDADRVLYSQEFNQLGQDVGNIANAQFNGVSLFSANGLDVTTDGEGNTFTMAGINLSSPTYTSILGDRVNVIGDTSTGAVHAMNDLKKIIKQLASDRAVLGANIERLEYHGDQMSTLKNSLSAATSRITDVDVAQESTAYARYNILVQSGTAMLAQANSLPQSVLKILG
jgi:flagellin